MTFYTCDYYGLAPVWGTVEVDAVDAVEAEFEAEALVRDLHDGIVQIDIKEIKEGRLDL